jgi:hypothetical protein
LIYLGFITEGKLDAVLIKTSLGVPNWPVIYIINYMPIKHQQVFWHRYRGLKKKKLPHQYRAITLLHIMLLVLLLLPRFTLSSASSALNAVRFSGCP